MLRSSLAAPLLCVALLASLTLATDPVRDDYYSFPIPGFFTIPTGMVGIFYRFGRLLEEFSPAGTVLKMPFPITRAVLVDVRPQVDSVFNVKCGTSDGLDLYFEEVKIYNQLRPDKVLDVVGRFGEKYDHILINIQTTQKIREMCASLTAQEVYIDKFSEIDNVLETHLTGVQDLEGTGLKINHVQVSKPIIPDKVRKNYERQAEEKTRLRAEVEAQNRKMKEAETLQKVTLKEAETERAVSAMANEKRIDTQKAEEEIQLIQNRMQLAKEKAKADSEAYRIASLAEANSKLLTPQYLKLQELQSLAQNEKIYFGESIPSVLINTVNQVPPIVPVQASCQGKLCPAKKADSYQ